MRVAVASVQVPFIVGGADAMTDGLCRALAAAGHEVQCVTMPFRFSPPAAVLRAMDAWSYEDFDSFACGPLDRVIALKFPAYCLRHPAKRVWLMHQHRSVYDLWDTPFGDSAGNPEHVALREAVHACDRRVLSEVRGLFTLSPTVSERLRRFNGITSTPLLQPPPRAELFTSEPAMPYVFVPSRLEQAKRQELLIRAMQQVPEPVFALVAGEGGHRPALERLVQELGLQQRVRFTGRLSDADMRRHYAHALCVFFGPMQEDYGFITLEAMLAQRPVITCTDSGHPAHLVRDGDTGFVVTPEPAAVAQAVATLWADRSRARAMGRAGRAVYEELGLSWDAVVASLLAD